MKKKLNYMLATKVLSSVYLILISVLCFPYFNIILINLNDYISISGIVSVIWFVLFGLASVILLLSIVSAFLLRKESSLFDRLSPIILLLLIFALFWSEGIFNGYDTVSAKQTFNILAVISLVFSILASIYWVKNVKSAYKKHLANSEM